MARFETLWGGLALAERALEQWLQRKWLRWAAVAALTSAVFALRAVSALQSPGVGGDYGHYLIAANWLAGHDNSGEGPFDPPLVPLILMGLVPILGKFVALQVLGPLAGASLVPAGFFLFRRASPAPIALAGAGLLALWPAYDDLLSFGGATNVFGLSASMVFFALFHDCVSRPRGGLKPNKAEVAAAAALFLVVSTHHLTAFITGVAVCIWAATLWVRPYAPRRLTLLTVLRSAGLGVGLGSIYLPYVLDLLGGEASSGFGSPAEASLISTTMAYIWRYDLLLWAGAIPVAVIGALRLSDSRPWVGPALGLAGAPMLLLTTILATHPARPLYHLQLPIALLVCIALSPRTGGVNGARRWSAAWPAVRAAMAAACAVTVIVSAAVTPALTAETNRFYHVHWQPGTGEALDWIGANTAQDSVVAVDGPVSPTFGFDWESTALGWLVEGYSNRRAIYQGHPPLLPFEAKWASVRDANRLFSGENVFEDGAFRISDSFPNDDWAGPRISIGYFGDYREYAAIAAPRLMDVANATPFWIISSADRAARPELSGSVGTLEGNYQGPGFSGHRTMSYSSSNHTVEYTLQMSLDAGTPWTALGATIVLPSWTWVNADALNQGSLRMQQDNGAGKLVEPATLRFEGTNVTGPTFTAGSSVQGENGYEAQWALQSPHFSIRITFTTDAVPTAGPDPHPLMLRTALDVLRDHDVSYVLVSATSYQTVRRLGLDPARFQPAFSNSAYFVYRVSL